MSNLKSNFFSHRYFRLANSFETLYSIIKIANINEIQFFVQKDRIEINFFTVIAQYTMGRKHIYLDTTSSYQIFNASIRNRSNRGKLDSRGDKPYIFGECFNTLPAHLRSNFANFARTDSVAVSLLCKKPANDDDDSDSDFQRKYWGFKFRLYFHFL